MKADRDYYVTENSRVTIKLDLFRKGNTEQARLDHVRFGQDRIAKGQSVDVSTFIRNAETWVAALEGGISTFDKPLPTELNWWKIPSGTEFPPELLVRRDHTGRDGRTHYSIAPAFDMPLTTYRSALASLHTKCQKIAR